MKKLHQVLNTIMGSSVGVLLGYTGYRYWHVQRYPELYAAQSAPWYTGILLYAAVTAAVLIVCILVKIFLWRRGKKK